MKQKTAEFQKNQFELIKSPVIAEFLGFKDEDTYLEGDLESSILCLCGSSTAHCNGNLGLLS